MRNEGRPHHQLEAWREAIALVKEVYEITRSFPKEEVFGLVAQMRRAAVSVPSNLAEGAACSRREFAHFLTIARGSLSELETQLIISAELGYMSAEHAVFERLDHVSRLLAGLAKKLSADLHP